MDPSDKYTSLICSLPACQQLFAAKITPVSRIQLEKRLRVMDPKDYEDIQTLGQILDWFQHPLERSDSELLGLVNKNLQGMHSPAIREYVEWRLEFRTMIAALRQKNLGKRFSADEAWGFGRWVAHINRHWNEKYFGLEKLHPWMIEVERLLNQENSMTLERFVLEYVWRWLEKESFGHEFDLEAVAIYRMRWDLVARWTSYTREPAHERFKQLLNAAFDAAQ